MNKKYISFFLLLNCYTFKNDLHSNPFWYQSIQTIGIIRKDSILANFIFFLPHKYTLWDFAPQKGAGITIGLIDQEEKKSKKEGHSFFMQKIIQTISPCVTIKHISAINREGKGDRLSFITALIEVLEKKISLINISLKIEDEIDKESLYTKTAEKLLSVIPYSIAASGNDGHMYKKNKPLEAYPAKFDHITFDIGAFGYNTLEQKYFIPTFSQYEINKGPKFVMPGISVGHNSLQGTSCSTALFSGFIALILGEFSEKNFTRDEILKVCYASSYFLEDTQEWHTKSLCGTVDMRLTFFLLYCIQKLRTVSLKLYNLTFTHFDLIIFSIKYLLCMQNNSDRNFKSESICKQYNFIDYLFNKNIYVSINFVCTVISYCFDETIFDLEEDLKIKKSFSDFTLKQIKVLLKERNNISIFESFDKLQHIPIQQPFNSCIKIDQNSIHYLGKTLMNRLEKALFENNYCTNYNLKTQGLP